MDAIKLMLKARRKAGEPVDDDELEESSLTKLMMPFEEKSYDFVYSFVRKLRWLFLKLSAGKMTLTTNEFQKYMLSLEYITKTCGLQRIDLHILFQQGTGNQQQIDIFSFYDLLNAAMAKCAEKSGMEVGNMTQFIDRL